MILDRLTWSLPAIKECDMKRHRKAGRDAGDTPLPAFLARLLVPCAASGRSSPDDEQLAAASSSGSLSIMITVLAFPLAFIGAAALLVFLELVLASIPWHFAVTAQGRRLRRATKRSSLWINAVD